MALHQALRSTRRLSAQGRVLSTPSIDWSKLGFDFYPTRSMLRHDWLGSSWDGGAMQDDFNISIHALSNVLHYGQGLFEGLKAFHCHDGKVRVFNSGANAARLRSGCERLQMPVVPPELFNEAIDRVVKDNVEFVPPYGSGGAMYLRPFLFGHGGKLGLGPAPNYSFCVVASPVGAYYKGGLQAIDAIVIDEFNRAAPRGVGNIKCAGNYAPDVKPSTLAKEQGFPICLYLDAKHDEYIEEFSTSNFIGITAEGTLVTPSSPSILPSTTKGVLLTLAADMGIKVEERPVPWSEISTFREVAACGTAVVLTPIKSITRGEQVHSFDSFETIERLYNAVTQLQVGMAPDVHGYNRVVAEKPVPA
uniref:Branched-chain-amino-acid transaminase n=1 Tax=Haptolina ericina TaxID=156174 RepID=A0A7S3AN54_9EUKA|mmetsp:Transcript_27088/g.61205  ORF Transcript_27088/g.61205 Transcript_27088/m.61205 type:complete len:362 (+) Transcript_27088:27-1112(+)